MIKVKCKTEDTCLLRDMVPFQGNLKKRNARNRSEMRESLRNDGLLAPFMLWRNDDKNYILDGHGRRESLIEEALIDTTILEQQFPCIFITAATEEEARKAVVQICSTYGRITSSGVRDFTATIVGYKAPIVKYIKTTAPIAKIEATKVIIRIRIDKDKAAQLLAILKDVDGLELY